MLASVCLDIILIARRVRRRSTPGASEIATGDATNRTTGHASQLAYVLAHPSQLSSYRWWLPAVLIAKVDHPSLLPHHSPEIVFLAL